MLFIQKLNFQTNANMCTDSVKTLLSKKNYCHKKRTDGSDVLEKLKTHCKTTVFIELIVILTDATNDFKQREKEHTSCFV